MVTDRFYGRSDGTSLRTFFDSCMSLRSIERAKSTHFMRKSSPSKMGVMVVVIVLHEGEILHHH